MSQYYLVYNEYAVSAAPALPSRPVAEPEPRSPLVRALFAHSAAQEGSSGSSFAISDGILEANSPSPTSVFDRMVIESSTEPARVCKAVDDNGYVVSYQAALTDEDRAKKARGTYTAVSKLRCLLGADGQPKKWKAEWPQPADAETRLQYFGEKPSEDGPLVSAPLP